MRLVLTYIQDNWTASQSSSSEGSSPKRKAPDIREQAGGSLDDEEDEEPVVCYSKQQRWPIEGEPLCVECGRYGAYIVDQTDQDVCSLECRARHLRHWEHTPQAQPATTTTPIVPGCHDNSHFLSSGVYLEHPAIASKTEEKVRTLRAQVCTTVCVCVCVCV